MSLLVIAMLVLQEKFVSLTKIYCSYVKMLLAMKMGVLSVILKLVEEFLFNGCASTFYLQHF